MIFLLAFNPYGYLYGLPKGQQVIQGQAQFSKSGNTLQIVPSDNAIINYDSFNIQTYETVRFLQQSSQSRVLNRVMNSLPTNIDGNLHANGQVYLVNPAGIYFGNHAVVDVGALYAAAGNIRNVDFLNYVDRF